MSFKPFLDTANSDPNISRHHEIERLNKAINEREIQIKKLIQATIIDEKSIKLYQKKINEQNQKRFL